MFPGENGERLGTAVGVVLAMSLAIAEQSLGFSLKSFGPVAAGLIALMVALVIYNMMRQAGASHMTGGSIALIVTYLGMRATVPGFFLWARENQWANYLHALVVLAVLVAIWRFSQAMFSSDITQPLKRLTAKSGDYSENVLNVSKSRNMEEWHLIRGRLAKLIQKGKKDSEKIINALNEIIDILKSNGSDERVASAVCRALDKIKTREHVLFLKLSGIENANRKLARCDLSMYQLQEKRFHKLSKSQQDECRTLLQQEQTKLGIEKRIATLAAKAERYLEQFTRHIDAACELLRSERVGDAIDMISKAIALEKGAAQLLEEIDKIEKTLEDMVEKQVAQIESMTKK
ncbi:hypothetical protein BVX94_02305 [bacterium B17]|nr:hypothetical protein BVX94_02305 [bacterium B17]